MFSNNNSNNNNNNLQGELNKKRKYDGSSDEEKLVKKPNHDSSDENLSDSESSDLDNSHNNTNLGRISSCSRSSSEGVTTSQPGSSNDNSETNSGSNGGSAGNVYAYLQAFTDAKKNRDEQTMNITRHNLRMERDFLVEKLSRLEDQDGSGPESPETSRVRQSLISADEAIRGEGLDAVIDDIYGNPDFFVLDLAIFDDFE